MRRLERSASSHRARRARAACGRRLARAEEEVLGELLGDRAAARGEAPLLDVLLDRLLDGLPVDALVAEEFWSSAERTAWMRCRETRESGTDWATRAAASPRLLLPLLHERVLPGSSRGRGPRRATEASERRRARRPGHAQRPQREEGREHGAYEGDQPDGAARPRPREARFMASEARTTMRTHGLRAERGAAAPQEDRARFRRERSFAPTRASGTRSRSSPARCSRSSASWGLAVAGRRSTAARASRPSTRRS